MIESWARTYVYRIPYTVYPRQCVHPAVLTPEAKARTFDTISIRAMSVGPVSCFLSIGSVAPDSGWEFLRCPPPPHISEGLGAFGRSRYPTPSLPISPFRTFLYGPPLNTFFLTDGEDKNTHTHEYMRPLAGERGERSNVGGMNRSRTPHSTHRARACM